MLLDFNNCNTSPSSDANLHFGGTVCGVKTIVWYGRLNSWIMMIDPWCLLVYRYRWTLTSWRERSKIRVNWRADAIMIRDLDVVCRIIMVTCLAVLETVYNTTIIMLLGGFSSSFTFLFKAFSSSFTSSYAHHLTPPSLSPSITPSAFYSRLKTHLFHKSFAP